VSFGSRSCRALTLLHRPSSHHCVSFHNYREQAEKFAKRRIALVAETAYFTVIIFCILWGVASTFLTPISYVFGALFGLAYSYGLGKYVETLGGSAEDAGAVQGAGVGQARFAFLILLFVIVGKFRSQGLQEIPAILGFFTYQLASLSQGEYFYLCHDVVLYV
jgi:hypothetical protein